MSTHSALIKRSSSSSIDTTDEEGETGKETNDDSLQARQVDFSTSIKELSGVWAALASPDESSNAELMKTEGLLGGLPAKFAGLATPGMNPMAMALSHEEVVVGCADGTI
jgi:pyrimidine and pyridine-specific 5'-nucleotidase